MPIFSPANRVRILSLLCLILGICQTIYGGKVFGAIETVPFGAWWAGVMIIIMSVFGFFVLNNCLMATVMGLGIVATIMGFAGAILDGVGYSFINSLHACSNTKYETWGDASYYNTAVACMLTNQGDNNDCACVKESLSDDNDPDCYIFGLYDGEDDCGSKIIDLPPLLHKSYSFALGASFIALVLCIMACGSVCCPGKCGTVEDSDTSQSSNSAPAVSAFADESGTSNNSSSTNEVHVVVATPMGGANPYEAQQQKVG